MRYFLLLACLLLSPAAYAQNSVITEYIQLGLDRNLGVQQQRYALGTQHAEIQAARGQFLPSLQVEARYSRAGGGRAITFPVGDLLNPVYTSLNDLTAQPGAFPTIANEQVPFLREREQESRLRLIQPLYQPQIRYNHQIQASLYAAQSSAVEVSERQLVADIKTAYYDYLAAGEAVAIFEASLGLVQENHRVNERLFANGKVTEDAVFRARTEVLAVEQQFAEAVKQQALAQSYFNTLLHRPLEATIRRPATPEALLADYPGALIASSATPFSTSLGEAASLATQQREELDQLAHALSAADANIRRTRSASRPTLAFVLDYGVQGTNYAIDRDADFWMASVSLQWNLFDGFQKRSRRAQARLQQQSLVAQQADLAQQIQLQAEDAHRSVEVARHSLATAKERLYTAEQTFVLVQRKYEEGMVNQIAFLDARTALTNAQLNLSLTQFALLNRLALLERATASYPLS